MQTSLLLFPATNFDYFSQVRRVVLGLLLLLQLPTCTLTLDCQLDGVAMLAVDGVNGVHQPLSCHDPRRTWEPSADALVGIRQR